MNLRNFFTELKRRNVARVAGLYLVGAWLLVQVAGTILPMFGAPDWLPRTIVILLAVGFVPALIFSWVFELTPQGLKRDEDVSPAESIAPQTARRMDRLIIVVLVFALGYFCFDKFVLTPRREAAMMATKILPNDHKSAIPEKSIAVLPFENLSSDKDNAYFAEGIQDEILTRLAKIGDLKVISRTSTQHFKSSPENLPEIAQQLGVRNILEGSVQREPNEVRVNVQLINAKTDAHLWAEIYDRKMTDVFSVESDIAKIIAATLQAKLTGSEKTALVARPTENPDAYQLYLKGRFFWNKRTGSDLKTAASYFEQAIAADPGYSGAYAGLAQTELLIPVFGVGKPEDYFPRAMVAARRAIALDETSAEGHAALGMLQVFDFKFESSEEEFKHAIALNPNYATAHHWYGNSLLLTLGRFDEAIAQGRRAVELDPLSLIINADLGGDYMLARRYDEAIAQLHRTLALDENFAYAHWNLGEALYLKGDLPGAIAEYQKAAALDDDPEILALLGRAYAETGQKEKALELLQKLKDIGAHRYVRNYVYSIIYTGLGDKKTAIDYLEKAREDSESPDTTWMKVDPLFDPLRSEPRFQALVAALFRAKKS